MEAVKQEWSIMYNKLMEKISIIKSVATVGLEPAVIEVEVNVGAGIPSLIIVGLPDKAVEEAKERVRLALKNSGFDFPQKKVVVNLAPADVKKEGPAFDLAIAIGVLSAAGQIEKEKLNETLFLGELSLTGKLRSTKGVIQAAIMARKLGMNLVVPSGNRKEASLVSKIKVMSADSLQSLVKNLIENVEFELVLPAKIDQSDDFEDFDFAQIVGQFQAKRAFEIAAAGAHNVLAEGSPGGGKTLLSRSMVSILPPLDEEEMLELTKIYSVAGLLSEDFPIVTSRPFRSPHHTTSSVAMIGGGTMPKPGEVTLAHKGVLFMDEFPEFPRSVLESLRQPIEDHFVTVSRAQGTIRFPADFILVGAKNPCPCGYFGDPTKECNCPAGQIEKYNRRISGPLLDRIDLRVVVEKIPIEQINSGTVGESSKMIRKRVSRAREIQAKRSVAILKKKKLNNQLKKQEIEKFGIEPEAAHTILESAKKLDLSMRGYIKTLRVARTIADLESTAKIKQKHVIEALQYRTQT